MNLRVLTFARLCIKCHPMTMARHRKPKTLSLDPDVVTRAEEWLKKQPGKPSLSGLIDDALTELLDRLEAKSDG